MEGDISSGHGSSSKTIDRRKPYAYTVDPIPYPCLSTENAVYMMDPPSDYVVVTTAPEKLGRVYRARRFKIEEPLMSCGLAYACCEWKSNSEITVPIGANNLEVPEYSKVICAGFTQRRMMGALLGDTVCVFPALNVNTEPMDSVMVRLGSLGPFSGQCDAYRIENSTDDDFEMGMGFEAYKLTKYGMVCEFICGHPKLYYNDHDVVYMGGTNAMEIVTPPGVQGGMVSSEHTSITIDLSEDIDFNSRQVWI